MRNIIHIIIVLLLFQGCIKSSLENSGCVVIVLDWNGKPAPTTPIKYLFYGDNGELVKEVTGNAVSVLLQLPAGRYNVLIYNPEVDRVVYSNMSDYIKAAASTPLLQSERYPALIGEPNAVYVANRLKESVVLVVPTTGSVKATAVMQRLTKQVKFRFTVNSPVATSSINGVIHGVSNGVLLSQTKYYPANCSVAFDTKTDNGSTFLGGISVFDIITLSGEGSSLDVALVDKNGGTYNGTFDLTKVIRDIINSNGGVTPDEILTALEFSAIGDGGMAVIVKPWDDMGTGGGNPTV